MSIKLRLQPDKGARMALRCDHTRPRKTNSAANCSVTPVPLIPKTMGNGLDQATASAYVRIQDTINKIKNSRKRLADNTIPCCSIQRKARASAAKMNQPLN